MINIGATACSDTIKLLNIKSLFYDTDVHIDVTFDPNLGKDKDKLAAMIGEYDGLAIRSATKATAKKADEPDVPEAEA